MYATILWGIKILNVYIWSFSDDMACAYSKSSQGENKTGVW